MIQNNLHVGLMTRAGDAVDAVHELIERYGLEEDGEHVIIPFRDEKGHRKRFFLLKRRYIRIVYPEGNFLDYPLEEAIEATVRYPELLLSEALYLLHKEAVIHFPEKNDDKTEANDSE